MREQDYSTSCTVLYCTVLVLVLYLYKYLCTVQYIGLESGVIVGTVRTRSTSTGTGKYRGSFTSTSTVLVQVAVLDSTHILRKDLRPLSTESEYCPTCCGERREIMQTTTRWPWELWNENGNNSTTNRLTYLATKPLMSYDAIDVGNKQFSRKTNKKQRKWIIWNW